MSNTLDQLEQASVADPNNPQLRYLLGAELAQNREYDRAVVELGRALSLAPEMHYARFQLGLLHLTMARPESAVRIWAPLENVSESFRALKTFKNGLEALIAERYDECIEQLSRGVGENTDNAPLNADMEKILARVRSVTKAPSTQAQSPAATESAQVWTDFSKYSEPDETRH